MTQTGRHHPDAPDPTDAGRLCALVDYLPAVAWIAYADGSVACCNQRWQEYTGLPCASGGPASLPPGIHPEDRPAAAAAWEAAVRAGQPFHGEHRLRRADGAFRWHRTSAAPALDSAGRAWAWVGVSTDIEDERRAAADLQASRALLDADSASAGIGGFRLDLATGALTATPEVGRLLGNGNGNGAPLATADDLVARVHPDDQAILRASLAACRGRGLALDARVRVVFPGGEVRVLRAAAEVRAGSGPALLVGSLQDVTGRSRAAEERRILDARLREAERVESLADLAGGVAHDFNNLLAGIVGYVTLAESVLTGDSPAAAHLSAAREVAERAARLARKMLAFSGRGLFATGPVDVAELTRGHAAALERLLPAGVRLRLDVEGHPVTVADAAQLRQVLEELVTNAGEAFEAGTRGTVTVSARATLVDQRQLRTAREGRDLPAGRYVQLAVEDTGAGMTHETLARVLDPFFSTKFVGRGLGMAAVRGIVRGHGGALFVESAPRAGTRVSVLLPGVEREPAPAPTPQRPAEVAPASPSPAPEPQPPRTEPAALRGDEPLVLVADDDLAVRVVTRRILQRRGFRVMEASDGEECLAVLAEHAADVRVVLLDVVMPNLDGEATLREIRRRHPGLRVLLASGYSNLDLVRRAREDAPDGFFPKPFDFTELVKRLRELAGGA